MDCTTAQESLSPLLDDALEPAKADEVRGHLRFCTGCAKAHEALREVSRRVRALGAASLPAGFRQRLERRRAAPAPAADGVLPVWWKMAPVMAAFALVLVYQASQRRPPAAPNRAEDELRTAIKRAPALAPPSPSSVPKRPAPAPDFSNESQAQFLAEQRDDLGIRSVGAQHAVEDAPSSMFGGSITDPANRPQVESTMRRMALISREIRERSMAPEVTIEGKTAPVLAKGAEGAAGAALADQRPVKESWAGRHSQNLEGTRTIYDAKEWEKVWHSVSKAPVPPIDFAKSQVAAVFLGARPTGGYAAEIVDAVLTPTALIVQWQEREPDPGAPAPDGETSPYALKVLARTDLPVRYQKLVR